MIGGVTTEKVPKSNSPEMKMSIILSAIYEMVFAE
jgi:hypothetical protein